MTDDLTGLFSRGFLEVTLDREMARCRRYGFMTSLVMLELDDFRAVTRRYGRCVGDAILQAVSELICRNLRTTDVPSRCGSHAFAIVLSDTYGSGAEVVAERLRAAVLKHFLERPLAGWLGLTVSASVASYGATCATGDGLLHAAERALDEAKAAGGDRVALSTPATLRVT